MIAVAVLVGLLLAVVAAGAGSDGADDVCVEAELRRVTITPDKLPVALLASTQLLYSATHDPDTDNWARELLDTHQDIQVSLCTVFKTILLFIQFLVLRDKKDFVCG